MKYDHLERADQDLEADTVGLWPGVAGVQMEKKADVFCPSVPRTFSEKTCLNG